MFCVFGFGGRGVVTNDWCIGEMQRSSSGEIGIQFFDEIPISKQNSPRWDAAFCGVILGLYCLPLCHKRDARLK